MADDRICRDRIVRPYGRTCLSSSNQISTNPIIRSYSQATSATSLHSRRSPWKTSSKTFTKSISTTPRRTIVADPPTMTQPYCASTIHRFFLALLTPTVDPAGSSVHGSLMSVERTSSLRIPLAGGRNTMWRIYMQHLTLKRWSRRRDSTHGGPAGETRQQCLTISPQHAEIVSSWGFRCMSID